MIGLSEKTLLAFSFAFSTFIPQSTPSASPGDLLIPREYMYVVKEGDSLSGIAEDKYGSSNYWTTVWNDNEWIENPNFIHSDLEITIRTEKPFIIEKPNRKFEYIYSRQPAQVQIVEEEATESTEEALLTEEQFAFLGNCESGMNPTTNTGNGYYGAFQFTIGTWNSMNSGYERADLAPLEVQKEAVQRLLVRSSIFTQFPACARKMQAAGLI